MSSMTLTGKQSRVLGFIRGYIASNQQSPTFAEIGRHFQMSSSASVAAVVDALEKAGRIKRTPNVGRGIEIVQ